MWTTATVLRLLSSAQLAALALVVLRGDRRDRSAQATVAFLVCCVAHTLLPPAVGIGLPGPVLDGVAIISLLLPLSFWLLAKVHFEDDFRLEDRHFAGLSAYLVVGYACWRAVTDRWPQALLPESASVVWTLVPRLVGLTLIVHALLTVYVGARSDLVVSRLRLRKGCLWVSGSYIFVELLAEAILVGSPAAPVASVLNSGATFAVVFVLTALAVRVRPEILKPQVAPPEDVPVLDPRLAAELRKLVEDEQVFRQEGLTIGALAERLGAHEYKVRELINDQLGFRNFNSFLNHYRVREAQKLLTNPDRRLNVAEAAYEVGYRSLGPFNKAFKDATGLTPTEFRVARAASTAIRPASPDPFKATNDPGTEPA
jgi:AraC-like DNA-binding protein